MFSKEMEALIEATLQDGVLTDQEKVVLVKRAQKEGIDVDELDVYIQSLLQKRQRELKEKNKEAFGRTCPNCGAQVPPLTLKCDCGYEFTQKAKVSSVQELSDKIEIIMNEPTTYSNVDGEDSILNLKKIFTIMDERKQRVMDLISMFPVPNTKEDIVEFLSLAAPKSIKKGGIMGTVMGRLSIFVPILVVIIILALILVPSTYVEDVHDGLFSSTTHQEIRHGAKENVIIPIIIFGTPAIFALAYLLDRKTLLWNAEANVWKAKFDQVLMKGRSLRGDSDFQRQLDYYENMINKK